MDLEDALKRLDKLTHEEARMATAETLKVTHAVDERVKEVVENVLGVDDRVAGLDQRVANVNDNVARVGERVVSVDNRVASIDDRVRAVDEKVAVVINGAQTMFSQNLKNFDLDAPRRKRSKTFVIIYPVLILDAHVLFQKTNYERGSINGSPRLTHRRTTTLRMQLIIKERQRGSLKEVSFKNGRQRVRFFGYMESVRFTSLIPRCPLTTYCICSWFWQERPLVRRSFLIP
jgi:hypothetical protein